MSNEKILPQSSRALRNPIVYKIITALTVIILAIGIYYLGDQNGSKRQKKISESKQQVVSSSLPQISTVVSRRWSAVGAVEEVSDRSIKVINSKGDFIESFITKATVITGTDGKITELKAVKKGSRIIAIGTKDEKDQNILTATRIRIQR
jgi:hypothetical protein